MPKLNQYFAHIVTMVDGLEVSRRATVRGLVELAAQIELDGMLADHLIVLKNEEMLWDITGNLVAVRFKVQPELHPTTTTQFCSLEVTITSPYNFVLEAMWNQQNSSLDGEKFKLTPQCLLTSTSPKPGGLLGYELRFTQLPLGVYRLKHGFIAEIEMDGRITV